MRNHLKAKKNRRFSRLSLVPRGGIEPGRKTYAWRSVDVFLPDYFLSGSSDHTFNMLNQLPSAYVRHLLTCRGWHGEITDLPFSNPLPNQP